MTITAKNIGRINVWPTYDVAREADTEESKFVGQLTVWRTNEEAQANTSHEEEGGGGGEPDWVPTNAKIHIDFLGGTPQGRAWVQGTGEVAIGTLLGNDPNADNFRPTGYNPAMLTANGYNADTAVATIGAARTMMFGGVTAAIQTKQIVVSSALIMQVAFVSADGNSGTEIDQNIAGSRDVLGNSWNGVFADATILDAINITSGAVNKIAFTVTSGRLELAANGSAAVTTAGSILSDAGTSLVANTIRAILNLPVQSITLYNPLPGTAGLSELSQVSA